MNINKKASALPEPEQCGGIIFGSPPNYRLLSAAAVVSAAAAAAPTAVTAAAEEDKNDDDPVAAASAKSTVIHNETLLIIKCIMDIGASSLGLLPSARCFPLFIVYIMSVPQMCYSKNHACLRSPADFFGDGLSFYNGYGIF